MKASTTKKEAGLSALTACQVATLRGIALGSSTKEIASSAGISVNSVHHHRSEIRRRLGMQGANDVQLARWAFAKGVANVFEPDEFSRKDVMGGLRELYEGWRVLKARADGVDSIRLPDLEVMLDRLGAKLPAMI